MNAVTIFTDGSSRGNPGPGGWGAIVATEDTVAELGGGEKHTTNNRMELTAVIRALEFISKLKTINSMPHGTMYSSAVIYLDSSYVMNGATKWIHGWQKKGWKTATKDDVVNRDLWEELLEILPLVSVEWKLVKGHSGVDGNERCDEIATSFADGEKMKHYNGKFSGYTINLSVKQQPSQLKTENLKLKTKKGTPFSYVSEIGGVVKIHTSWTDCEKRVKGKSGARFKKVFSQGEETELISSWKKHN